MPPPYSEKLKCLSNYLCKSGANILAFQNKTKGRSDMYSRRL